MQVLLDMATGGRAKLEPLIVDKAGVFDAGLNKGYNPVTVAGGNTSVTGEKSAVVNHGVVITPKAAVTAGWQDGKSVTGEGVNVSASELVSGNYNVSQAGSADVTNYQNVVVKSGGTTASVDKTTVDAHTVRFTPKANVTQGWQDDSVVSGDSVDVAAGELVSGTYPVTESGEFDVSAYEKISVPSGVVAASATKGMVAGHTVTVTPKASRTAGFINSGETEGLGVNVTASELVSGTLNVSASGTQDVTNYESISVPSGGHRASATKGPVNNHSVSVTPKSTATAGFVGAGEVSGTPVSVSASELVSGTMNVTANGVFDITNYKLVDVNIDAPLKITAIGAGSGALTLDVSGTKFSGVLPTAMTFFAPMTYGVICGFWTSRRSAALGIGDDYTGYTRFNVSLDSQGNYFLLLNQGTGGVPADFTNNQIYTFYIE